ncbi:hypothetical protein VTO73DRAFT_8904 [Trametes versicolor]
MGPTRTRSAMEPRSQLLWYSAGFMFSEDQGRRQNDAAITLVAKRQGNRKRVHVRSIQPHASNRTPANFGARLPPPVGRRVPIEQHSYPGPPLFPIRRGSCSTGCGRLRGGFTWPSLRGCSPPGGS